MSNYIVSARKYRPGTFASVVGQSHVSNTLKSAILLDQLAHAFLFSGPRGVGKTTCARILAKAINCENLREDGEPCNECESCQSYNQGKSINIHELDAASNNSVDDIRNLIEQTRYVPANGKKSVYIIDEVHMLSQAAFNAFLKTLEEPPEHVLFILATTERHKILPTILSRCQKFDFRRIKVDDIAKHLEYISKEEKVEFEYAALQQIAMKADGALRDALSLYDQLVSFSGGTLTFSSVLENLNILDYDYYFQAVELIKQQDHSGLLLALNEIIEKGFEAKDFITGLTEHFRNLLVCQDPKTVQLIESSENVKSRYLQQSQVIEGSFLLNAFHLCSEAEQKTRLASHPRLVVELLLVKLAHLQSAIKVASGATLPAAEKKKPVAEHNQTQIQDTNSSSSSAETPTPESHPQTISPEPESQTQTEPPPPSRRRKNANGLAGKGLGSLDAFQKELARKKAEEPEEEEEIPQEYTVNPSINISESTFKDSFDTLLKRLRAENQILASTLENADIQLHHNCMKVRVRHEMGINILHKETAELLPFFRQSLSVPELFMELTIDESLQDKKEEIPYTPEQKLRVMSQENPALARLQKIFKTRIIY